MYISLKVPKTCAYCGIYEGKLGHVIAFPSKITGFYVAYYKRTTRHFDFQLPICQKCEEEIRKRIRKRSYCGCPDTSACLTY